MGYGRVVSFKFKTNSFTRLPASRINDSYLYSIFSSLCIKSRVKILNSSAKYWGGQIQYAPPNQIIGGAMPPLAPLSRPPCAVQRSKCKISEGHQNFKIKISKIGSTVFAYRHIMCTK